MDWKSAYNDIIAGDVREGYNEWARAACGVAAVSSAFTPLELTCIEFCRGHVLDVGCGDGRFSANLLRDERVSSVVALDVSDVCIHMTQQTFEAFGVRGQCVNASIEDFHSEQILDTVACWEVIEHLRNPHLVLAHIGRMMAVDGALIGSVPEGRAHDNELHLQHFKANDLLEMLLEYFEEVRIRRYFLAEAGSVHLVFAARFPIQDRV